MATEGLVEVTHRYRMLPDRELSSSTAHVDVVEVPGLVGRKWVHKRPPGNRIDLQKRTNKEQTATLLSNALLENEFNCAAIVTLHENVILPNALVWVRDVGRPDGQAYVAVQTPYCEGVRIDAYIKAHYNRLATSGVPEPDALRQAEVLMWELLLQVAKGLAHIHRCGVAHFDCNSSNILVNDEDPNMPPTAKIIDFGHAQISPAKAKEQEKECQNDGGHLSGSHSPATNDMQQMRDDANNNQIKGDQANAGAKTGGRVQMSGRNTDTQGKETCGTGAIRKQKPNAAVRHSGGGKRFLMANQKEESGKTGKRPRVEGKRGDHAERNFVPMVYADDVEWCRIAAAKMGLSLQASGTKGHVVTVLPGKTDPLCRPILPFDLRSKTIQILAKEGVVWQQVLTLFWPHKHNTATEYTAVLGLETYNRDMCRWDGCAVLPSDKGSQLLPEFFHGATKDMATACAEASFPLGRGLNKPHLRPFLSKPECYVRRVETLSNTAEINTIPTDPAGYSFHEGVGHPLNPVIKDAAEAHLKFPLRFAMPLLPGVDPKPMAAAMLAHVPPKTQPSAKTKSGEKGLPATLAALGIAPARVADGVVWLDAVPGGLGAVCEAVAASCVQMLGQTTFLQAAYALKMLPSAALCCPIRVENGWRSGKGWLCEDGNARGGLSLALRHCLEAPSALPEEGSVLTGRLILRLWGATVRWDKGALVVAPRIEVEGPQPSALPDRPKGLAAGDSSLSLAPSGAVDLSTVPTDATSHPFFLGVGHPLNPVWAAAAEAHLQCPLRVSVALPPGSDPRPMAAQMLAHLPATTAPEHLDKTVSLAALGVVAAAGDGVVWLDAVPGGLGAVCEAVAASCVQMLGQTTFLQAACALKMLPQAALTCSIRVENGWVRETNTERVGLRLALHHHIHVPNPAPPAATALSGRVQLRLWGATVRCDGDLLVVAPRIEVEALHLHAG